MGYLPHARAVTQSESMGCFSVDNPYFPMGSGPIFSLKDWVSTGFPFSSFSHKLRVKEKEYDMSIITLAAIFLLRVLLPLSILVALGEWVRKRDIRNWWKGR